jgi:hypothetical protein
LHFRTATIQTKEGCMRIAVTHAGLIVALFTTLTLHVPASATHSSGLDATLDACGCRENRTEALQTLRDEIAAAADLEDAKGKALAHVDAAHKTLRTARRIMPWSDELRDAAQRVSDARARIDAASEPREVADEFSSLVRIASVGMHDGPGFGVDNDVGGEVEAGGCDYSGGEIVAIVFGFIFGIIPGIILLFVLC